MSASVEPLFPGQESLDTDYDKISQDCKAVNTDLLSTQECCLLIKWQALESGRICEKANDFAIKLKERKENFITTTTTWNLQNMTENIC